VLPKHFGGGEGDSQKITEFFGLAEKLHMACMNDVVTTGDKNVTHRVLLRWRLKFPKARIVENFRFGGMKIVLP
jgi:hypothetical protein